ncbi:MAG: MHYT domain-containing protein, partial [Candidatus Acidiferrum sp.]
MGESEVPLAGFYDYRLVVLSVLVAISASYAALDLGARVTAAHGRLRWAWLAGGAIALGLGIWCMHFVGMLAFRLPIAVAYHLPTVVLSLLVAILASAMALGIASREKMGRIEALTGSVLMGAGIAGMHYIGMAAMRFPAMYRYRPPIVAASVLVAIVASLVAIVFCFDYREDFRGTTAAKILSAGAMGAAISLMHYTGMAAAYFSPSGAPVNLAHTVSVSSLGAAGAGMATLLVQAIAILT